MIVFFRIAVPLNLRSLYHHVQPVVMSIVVFVIVTYSSLVTRSLVHKKIYRALFVTRFS